MSDPKVTIQYIHSADLFRAVSINMAWIVTQDKKSPMVEIFVNGGRGPDMTKRMFLTLEGSPDTFHPQEIIQFATEVLEGAKKMQLEMEAKETPADDS